MPCSSSGSALRTSTPPSSTAYAASCHRRGDFASPMPYVGLQQMLDESNAWGFHDYEKGTYLEELTDAAIEVVVEHLPRKTSPLSLVLLYRLDGAYSRGPDDATGLQRRPLTPVRGLQHRGLPDPGPARRRPRLGPVAVGGTAPPRARVRYLRQLDHRDRGRPGALRVRTGEVRAARPIKAMFDPDNVFRRNAEHQACLIPEGSCSPPTSGDPGVALTAAGVSRPSPTWPGTSSTPRWPAWTRDGTGVPCSWWPQHLARSGIDHHRP